MWLAGWLAMAHAATLTVGDLVQGAEVTATVIGAPAGATVTLYGSTAGTSATTCPAAFTGPCLQLPVTALASAPADPSGTAVLQARIPEDAPLGDVALQAVWATPGAGSTPAVVATVHAPTRVVLVGDSITEGQLSGGAGDPYGLVLQQLLGDTWQVDGIGCGGASIVDWTIPMGNAICGGQLWSPTVYEARAVPLLPAPFVTVMLGTNDSTGFFEPSPTDAADYRRALDHLVGNLLADGAGQVVLMTPPPQCPGAPVQRLLDYRDEVLDVCATTPDVVCGPDVYTLLGPADFAGCDVHPNAQGHATIADALATTLLAL